MIGGVSEEPTLRVLSVCVVRIVSTMVMGEMMARLKLCNKSCLKTYRDIDIHDTVIPLIRQHLRGSTSVLWHGVMTIRPLLGSVLCL